MMVISICLTILELLWRHVLPVRLGRRLLDRRRILVGRRRNRLHHHLLFAGRLGLPVD